MTPKRSGERKFFEEGLRHYVPGRIALDEIRRQVQKQCHAVAKEKAAEIAGRLGVKGDVKDPTPYDWPTLGKLESEDTWVETGAQVKAATWTIFSTFWWNYNRSRERPYFASVWIFTTAAGGRKRLDALYAELRKKTRRTEQTENGAIGLWKRADASPQGIRRTLERVAQDAVGLLRAPGVRHAIQVR